jgi:hypothetical protein
MKVGLSNHQSVCVCVCVCVCGCVYVSVCPPLITFELLVHFNPFFWYGGDAIQVDLDSVIFNPISSTILK